MSDNQPGQQELRGPCRRRKIWRKETKQTTNNLIDILHTQSTDYIVADVATYLKEREVAV